MLATISLVRTWFRQWTTELVITDRRVIYKTGFIRRSTVEMNMDKVERAMRDFG
nr:PH domain-containing protein [Bradyrhizobium japonicum]